MPINLVIQAPKIKYYSIKGDTLEDIWNDIIKKGPKDPNDNKKVAALTYTSYKTSSAWNHEIIDKSEISDGQTTVKMKIKDLNILYWSKIKFPKLGSNKLSANAKKEWARFIAKLKPHEMEHVTKGKAEMDLIVKELEKMEGSGIGKGEEEAVSNARKHMEEAFQKKYGNKKIEERLNKVHKKFDHAKGHGPKLNYSIK